MVRKTFTPEQIIDKLRYKLLDRKIFYTLNEVKMLVEQWRREYNQVRPHSPRLESSLIPTAK